MIAVSEEQLKIVKDILNKYVPNCEVRAFGSRYKWTNKDYSDLDLAIVGDEKLDLRLIGDIKEAFQESELPFRIDVLDWHKVSDEFRGVIEEGYEVIQGVAKSRLDISKCKLTDLCFGGGSYGIAASATEYSSNLPTYLRITDIKDDGTLNLDGMKSVNDKNSDKYYLSPNDIVFARTGASTGRNYFYDGKDGELVYAGFLIKFSIDPAKVNPKYLKYYCQSKIYNDWISSFNTGSTRGNINARTLGNMPVTLLSREKQDLLVNTLSYLDDKIELNNRMNKTLEEMAQAIFKSWFVDFEPFQDGEFEDSELGMIPKGWRAGNLSEITDILMGQSPKGSSYNEVGEGTVFYQGRTDFGTRFPTVRLCTTEPKRMANRGDVLLSVRAPVGDINIALESCCIGRGLASLRSKNGHSSFLYYLLQSMRKKFDVYNGEGTVFGSINKITLHEMELVIPDKKSINSFEEVVLQIDKLIEKNETETRELVDLRDTLLPKFMSGEIRVLSEVITDED